MCKNTNFVLQMHSVTNSMICLSLVTFVVLLCSISTSHAQLNFSPGWGKRAESGGGGMSMLEGGVHRTPRVGVRGVAGLLDATRLMQDDDGSFLNAALNSCNNVPIETIMKIYRLIKVSDCSSES